MVRQLIVCCGSQKEQYFTMLAKKLRLLPFDVAVFLSARAKRVGWDNIVPKLIFGTQVNFWHPKLIFGTRSKVWTETHYSGPQRNTPVDNQKKSILNDYYH